MREKFIDHLLRLQWAWDAEHLESKETDILSPFHNPTHEFIYKKLFDYWENAFTIPEGERMVRNAMFVFSDSERRQKLCQEQFKKMMDRF